MEKIGRNDPCPCGSGKKHKQCCLLKKGGSGLKRKLTAKWLNPKAEKSEMSPQVVEEVNLMERTFGHALHKAESFKAVSAEPSQKEEAENTGEKEEKS